MLISLTKFQPGRTKEVRFLTKRINQTNKQENERDLPGHFLYDYRVIIRAFKITAFYTSIKFKYVATQNRNLDKEQANGQTNQNILTVREIDRQ